jgi:coniferyl-aldehyde dehydrogenase
MSYSKTQLENILSLQREAFRREGEVTADVRRSRVSRMALAILENIDVISDAVSVDYGYRPPALTKAFEGTSWIGDIQETLDNLEKWMSPIEVSGGFVQKKPKGVVGIIGAWNFPITLTFEPAMEALAAGNRVMLNFSEFHPRTGAVLADIIGKTFPQEEVAFIHGDLSTAQQFSGLRFDHLFFTGSPKVGSIISQAAAKNLVPVTMELGGKNPVVVARDADIELATRRIASTRVLNGGQICLCPDYVFVPRETLPSFVGKLKSQFSAFFPDYLTNPNVVTIVNARNYDRVTGLINDAAEKGAQVISVVSEAEAMRLPDANTRRIPPTLLLDVPDTARIEHEEIFGPVLVIHAYDELQEALDYINTRPSPLAAYWYGQDGEEFREFLNRTTSGGVTRNDGIVHAVLPGAPFGGIGNSGSGAYHGKAGFDTFTHLRAVANSPQEKGIAEDLVNGTLMDKAFQDGVNSAITQAIDTFKAHIA